MALRLLLVHGNDKWNYDERPAGYGTATARLPQCIKAKVFFALFQLFSENL
jgi:hypothetical protein